MTRKFSSPAALTLVLLAVSLLAAPAALGLSSKKKKSTAAPAKSSARDRKGRAEKASAKTAGRQKTSARETRASKQADKRRDARAARNERAAKNDRDARQDRRDRKDRRASAKESDRKDTRKMSRRERLAEARREAERRRREEAERRAEAARQAAIARALAIARQRAADQALKDESAANILKDNTTGEDLEVRRAAVEALGDHAGTVVVMNPKDGRVYTVVNQDWGVRKGFKPCSTIKLVSGLAGLAENVIDPVQTVNIGTGSFRLDLTDSLALSNNGYFQRVGGEVGFDRMMDYARKLGLGAPTGINHAYESPGRLPVQKNGFAVNRMSSHGDDIEVTPVQLATMVSALSNGGELLVPHLPRTPQENVNFKKEVRRRVDVPQEHVRRLVPGMIGAVNYGTAKLAQDPTQSVAGKTGSCIGQGSWLGLFASYAPVHDPQLAVSVVLRGSGERGRIAAGVAGKIYRRLNHRFGVRPGTRPMLANEMIAPRPRIDLNKAAAVSDEEAGEESAAEGDAYLVSEAGGASANRSNASAPSNVQKTSRTVERPAYTAPRTAPAATVEPAPAQPRHEGQGTGRPRRVFSDRP